MQRISVNLTNDCGGNQPHCNNDLPAIRNKNYALQKSFESLIEKKFEQKFTFVPYKRVFFSKSNFSNKTCTEITEIIFSTSCKEFKIFSSILFEKKTIGPRLANFPYHIH